MAFAAAGGLMAPPGFFPAEAAHLQGLGWPAGPFPPQHGGVAGQGQGWPGPGGWPGASAQQAAQAQAQQQAFLQQAFMQRAQQLQAAGMGVAQQQQQQQQQPGGLGGGGLPGGSSTTTTTTIISRTHVVESGGNQQPQHGPAGALPAPMPIPALPGPGGGGGGSDGGGGGSPPLTLQPTLSAGRPLPPSYRDLEIDPAELTLGQRIGIGRCGRTRDASSGWDCLRTGCVPQLCRAARSGSPRHSRCLECCASRCQSSLLRASPVTRSPSLPPARPPALQLRRGLPRHVARHRGGRQALPGAEPQPADHPRVQGRGGKRAVSARKRPEQ
jgi:hypothetical protein